MGESFKTRARNIGFYMLWAITPCFADHVASTRETQSLPKVLRKKEG